MERYQNASDPLAEELEPDRISRRLDTLPALPHNAGVMRKPWWPIFSRRGLFQRGAALAAAHWVSGTVARVASAAPMQLGNLYRSIGVRPMINAHGTYT